MQLSSNLGLTCPRPRSAAPAPAPADPFWADTVYAINFHGTNGSSDFSTVDGKGNAFAVWNAAPTISTLEFPQGAMESNSIGASIACQNVPNCAVGANVDFTWEIEFRPTVFVGGKTISRHYADTTGGPMFLTDSSSQLSFSLNGFVQLNSTGVLTLDTMHTLIVQRLGGTIYMVLNGVQLASSSHVTVPNALAFDDVYIGNGDGLNTGGVRATFRAARFTKAARYPTLAWPTSLTLPLPTS